MRDVRIAIDENRTSEQLVSDDDIDTLALDELISSKIEEAARKVIASAPIMLLDGGRPVGDALYWRGDGVGWVLLPDDFLRLVVFKMSDWERPVHTVVAPGTPTYQLQFSRCKGLRGNPQKPIVALTRRAEGLALEFFSCCTESAVIEMGSYIPLPRIRDGYVNLPERCYKAVVYETASLVLVAMGQGELASFMSNIAKELMV